MFPVIVVPLPSPCSPPFCEANSSTMRENFDALLALGKAVLPLWVVLPCPTAGSSVG